MSSGLRNVMCCLNALSNIKKDISFFLLFPFDLKLMHVNALGFGGSSCSQSAILVT